MGTRKVPELIKIILEDVYEQVWLDASYFLCQVRADCGWAGRSILSPDRCSVALCACVVLSDNRALPSIQSPLRGRFRLISTPLRSRSAGCGTRSTQAYMGNSSGGPWQPTACWQSCI